MEIKILYEDENILAIDKPSSILVHPDERSSEETILDIFLKKYPEIEIVHRLDYETSGVMLLAKNKNAHEFLKKQFQDREIKKTYFTLVYGEIKKDFGVIDQPIGRSPTDFRRRLAGRGARGEMRDSITEYKVLKRLEVEGQKYSLVEVMPKTGRTHQIRVHMKYLSYPVVCDKLYAPKNLCPSIFGRLMLHAKSIEFTNLENKVITVESLLPKEFDF